MSSLIRHVRSTPFVYGSAVVLPFGFTFYPIVHSSLVERYSNIVSKYDANTTVPYLIGINVFVFLAWQLGKLGVHLENERLCKLLLFMGDHFRMQPKYAFRGGWHTHLTSMFSHIQWWHLILNMNALWSFAGPTFEALGREVFLFTFLGAFLLQSFDIDWRDDLSKGHTVFMNVSIHFERKRTA